MTTVFKALSDDTRRQILKLLANGDMTAKELLDMWAEHLNESYANYMAN